MQFMFCKMLPFFRYTESSWRNPFILTCGTKMQKYCALHGDENKLCGDPKQKEKSPQNLCSQNNQTHGHTVLKKNTTTRTKPPHRTTTVQPTESSELHYRFWFILKRSIHSASKSNCNKRFTECVASLATSSWVDVTRPRSRALNARSWNNLLGLWRRVEK